MIGNDTSKVSDPERRQETVDASSLTFAVYYLYGPVAAYGVPGFMLRTAGYNHAFVLAPLMLPAIVALLAIIRAQLAWTMLDRPQLRVPDGEDDFVFTKMVGVLVIASGVWMYGLALVDSGIPLRGFWQAPTVTLTGILILQAGLLLHLRNLPPHDQWPKA